MIRSHGSTRAWLAVVATIAMASFARDAQTQSATSTVAPFRLVRCGPRRDAACFAARLTLPPNAAIGAATGAQWSAELAGVGMVGPEQPVVSGAAQPDITPVFGAPVLPTSSLARVALHGSLTLSTRGQASVTVPATWRPPLLALPAFVGVADSASLPAPVRDALATGAEPPGIRALVGALLLITGVLLMVYVPRFAWTDHRESEEDLARQLAASRALLSTQELEELRGKAPREATARDPEDPTKEARRTW